MQLLLSPRACLPLHAHVQTACCMMRLRVRCKDLLRMPTAPYCTHQQITVMAHQVVLPAPHHLPYY